MLPCGLTLRYAMPHSAIDLAETDVLIQLGRLWSPLSVVRLERLQLFVNVIMRFA